MKYNDEIVGNWESALETLEHLEPKKQHGIKLGQNIQFKASALITLNFQKDMGATIRYDFEQVKPV